MKHKTCELTGTLLDAAVAPPNSDMTVCAAMRIRAALYMCDFLQPTVFAKLAASKLGEEVEL